MIKKDIDWSTAKRWVPGTVYLDEPANKIGFNRPDNDPSTVSMMAGSEEMLRITKEGFWVRGVQVPQDEQEAAAVYTAFREWMTWAALTRQY